MNYKIAGDGLFLHLNGVPSEQFQVVVDYNYKIGDLLEERTKAVLSDSLDPVQLTPEISNGEDINVVRVNIFNPSSSSLEVSIYNRYTGLLYTERKKVLGPGASMVYYKNSGWVDNTDVSGSILQIGINGQHVTGVDDIINLYGYEFLPGLNELCSGQDRYYQDALWNMYRVEFLPYSTTGIWIGTSGANLGSATTAALAITNKYTMRRRQSYGSVVTTLNQQVGTRTDALFTINEGFFIVCAFGFQVWTVGNKLFVGVSVGTTAVVTGNPSSQLNIFGFCMDAGDTQISLLHNDGFGVGTKDVVDGQALPLAANQGWTAVLYCPPGGAYISWMLINMLTGSVMSFGQVITDLPQSNVFMCFQAIMSNGNNPLVGAATIGVCNTYIKIKK